MTIARAAAWGIVLLLGLTATGRAQSSDDGFSGGVRGWGPRVGLASDPDQLVFGIHLDAGRFSPRVRFQPDFELGVGDDVLILDFTGAVHYRFPVRGDLKPYAGGGLSLGFIDVDAGPGVDDDDIDFAIEFLGGLEWAIGGNDLFFLEFAILGGGLQDFKILAGWTL